MMDFGAGFGEVEAVVGGGDKKFPPYQGYTWVITDVINAPSKKGDPMMRFDADIAEGEFSGFFSEYNKRLYQLYGVANITDDKDAETNEKRQGRMKGLIETIVADNPAMFPEKEINWNTFEEKRLIGCTVGGSLKQDGKYSKLAYICSKERAAELPVTEPTKVEDVKERGSEGSEGGLF